MASSKSPKKGARTTAASVLIGANGARGSNPLARWTIPAICLSLVGLVWLIFGQTLWHGFVNFDDPEYVSDNPWVVRGVTLQGIAWAFTHVHSANWHPLTWISHMLDCQLFGLHAGGHHCTSVVLHAVASVLVFLVMREFTGFLWRSAFIAALFAVHPQHVESVAWISERKDVLSAVFFLLTLWAYARYARSKPSLYRYSLVVVFFALGLMSKPMLVTVPCVLLLLDYWPLRRLNGQSGPPTATLRSLAVEKIPLFALTVASSIGTALAQRDAMGSFTALPFLSRLENAIMAYGAYIAQALWPSGLAAFYPLVENGVGLLPCFLALLLLGAVTAAAWGFRKRHPWLPVGWFWFLGMLVPVIGLVQVGSQARADRYMYLPSLGLYLIVAFLLHPLARRGRSLLIGSCIAAVAALALLAYRQAGFWHDGLSLWTRAMACNDSNFFILGNLGDALIEDGKPAEAVPLLKSSVEQQPTQTALTDLGSAYCDLGRIPEAIEAQRKTVQLFPKYPKGWNNLGVALTRAHRPQEAIPALSKALELKPWYAIAENNFGNAVCQQSRFSEAIGHYRKAIEFNPAFATAYFNLGNTLLLSGKIHEGVAPIETALRLNPNYVRALDRLARVRATCPDNSLRDGESAVRLAERAVQLSNGSVPFYLATLAAAQAEAGSFFEALQTARDALQRAEAQSDSAFAAAVGGQIKGYEAHKPIRDEALLESTGH